MKWLALYAGIDNKELISNYLVYIHVVIVYYNHILLSEVSHLTHDSYEEDDIREWFEEMTWDFIMRTELHMLKVAHSHREKDLDLYI